MEKLRNQPHQGGNRRGGDYTCCWLVGLLLVAWLLSIMVLVIVGWHIAITTAQCPPLGRVFCGGAGAESKCKCRPCRCPCGSYICRCPLGRVGEFCETGECCKSYNGIKLLTENITDALSRFYATTMQRRPKHPLELLLPYFSNWSNNTFCFL